MINQIKNKTKGTVERIPSVLLAAIAIVAGLNFIGYVLLECENEIKTNLTRKIVVINTASAGDSKTGSDNNSDESDSERIDERRTATVTAYTSREEETDASPYITADGTDLRKIFYCSVANNKLAFGTKVEIEGIGTCTVHDRGAERHGDEWFDLYLGNDLKRAKEFGKKELNYKVL